MSYCIGELEVQGKQPSNVVHVVFKTASGEYVGIRATKIAAMPQPDGTAPSEHCPPAWDPA